MTSFCPSCGSTRSATTCEILALLRRSPNGMRLRDIAVDVDRSPAAVSGLLTTLHKADLVEQRKVGEHRLWFAKEPAA